MEILKVVEKIKVKNLKVVYFCDFVMGYFDKGCIVVFGVVEFLCDEVMVKVDLIVLNLVEL